MDTVVKDNLVSHLCVVALPVRRCRVFSQFVVHDIVE